MLERMQDGGGMSLLQGGLGTTLTGLFPPSRRLEEVPLEVLRQRESKWLDMLNNWDKWMAKKHKKVRDFGFVPWGCPGTAVQVRGGGREGQPGAALSP